MTKPQRTRRGPQLSQLRLPLLAALATLATPALAQTGQKPTTYDRSIAAGYKALMLCGAIFNGGRTQAQAEALELTGIYPEYDPIVPTLKAEVRATQVRVPFDDALPARVASWNPAHGCTIQPIGAPEVALSPSLPSATRPLDSQPWPMGDRGFAPKTPAALAAPIARAFDGAFRGRTTGIVILRDGKPIAEHYAEGFGPHTAQRTWSVAKSIAGTLIGIAAGEGSIATDAPIFPGRADLRGTIRLDQALRMGSGLHIDVGNRTDELYFGGKTVDEDADARPLDAMPGARFRYSNIDIVLAVRALRRALNDDGAYAAFPRERLFAKLGMTRTVAEREAAGNFVLSSQTWSTARDFARLGQFWLQDGVWNGQRILPQGWVKYMTTPSGPQPLDGPGYGATLWLFGPKQGLPEGSYAAQGNRGQFIMVVPSKKLVIVRRGEDASGSGFDIAKFSAEVVGALE